MENKVHSTTLYKISGYSALICYFLTIPILVSGWFYDDILKLHVLKILVFAVLPGIILLTYVLMARGFIRIACLQNARGFLNVICISIFIYVLGGLYDFVEPFVWKAPGMAEYILFYTTDIVSIVFSFYLIILSKQYIELNKIGVLGVIETALSLCLTTLTLLPDSITNISLATMASSLLFMASALLAIVVLDVIIGVLLFRFFTRTMVKQPGGK